MVFWLEAWLGTTTAGGIFGILTGGAVGLSDGVLVNGVAGLFLGAILAGVVGAPIHFTMAVMTWVLWLSRFSAAMSGIAGAMTGIVAASVVFGWQSYLPVALAALSGGLGGALGGGLYRAKFARRPDVHDAQAAPRWQFSIRELLLRFAVLAALISGWNWFYVSIHDTRPQVSEVDLKSRFLQHRDEFTQLALMFRRDDRFCTIHGDGSYDERVMDRQRGEEYLALLRRAGLSNSTVYSVPGKDVRRIEIIPAATFRAGVGRGYVFTTSEPTPIVDRLDDHDPSKLRPGETLYTRLEEGWYLFMRKPSRH